jgi:hypothetical protein
MALTIEETTAECYETPPTPAPREANRGQPPPDMDRIRRELRREHTRLERLWAD